MLVCLVVEISKTTETYILRMVALCHHPFSLKLFFVIKYVTWRYRLMKNTGPKIIDDKFTTLLNDIDKVQKAPTMYISFRGPQGGEHLAYELFNNAIDEDRNPNTVSDGNIYIHYDGETGMCYFRDTGRGINFDDLENACTILQSGTKMDREFGGSSGGEYGVGMTACAALSERFEITSTRNGQMKFLRFSNGKKVEDRIASADPSIHGLTVGFKPSTVFLGEDACVPFDSLASRIRRIVYTLADRIKIHLTATDVDGNEIMNQTYQNTDGLAGFITSEMGEEIGFITPKPITLKNSMVITETNIPNKVTKEDGTIEVELISKERFINIEFSFDYSPKIVEPIIYAFTNSIEQPDGGVHVNSFKRALSTVLHEKVTDSMKKSDTLEVLPDDALTGLVAVVNLDTDHSTGFESQTKHKLGNMKFNNPLRKLYTEALNEYFNSTEGKKELKKIIDFIKLNAKIRNIGMNQRKKVKTSLPSLMDSKLIGNYTAANNIGVPKDQRDIELELYLGEGDSAGGQMRKARFNPDYQGILNFTGKPDNYYSMTRIGNKKILTPSNVYAILLDKVIGCGYGNHFDIDNLIYDKIIFGFDADVDGEHMAGLTLTSIYAVAPQLVIDGHCYRVITPLYKVAASQAAANKMDKKNPNIQDYVYTKMELFERFEENVQKFARIKFSKNEDFISKNNMQRFLAANRDYYQVLDRISNFESVPKEVIEYIAANPDFEKSIGNLDKELHYKDGIISGCFNGDFVAVSLNSSVMESIDYLRNVIQKSNDGIYQYEFYDRRGESADFNYVGKLTIGQIMEICQKYSPYIVNRYKGLGEMSKYEMYKLAMNPNYRRLVRYTISDVQRFEDEMDKLFLMNDKGRRSRKEYVQHANLSLDEIDN